MNKQPAKYHYICSVACGKEYFSNTSYFDLTEKTCECGASLKYSINQVIELFNTEPEEVKRYYELYGLIKNGMERKDSMEEKHF